MPQRKRLFALLGILGALLASLALVFTVPALFKGASRASEAGNTTATPAAHPSSTGLDTVEQSFEKGVVYPRWSQDAYGANDSTWQNGLLSIKANAGANWIEIPVLFTQTTRSSTAVTPSQAAPSLEAFASGIGVAHSLGYSVFFVPLIQSQSADNWAGSIQFQTEQQTQTWFDSYWQALQPYAQVAAQQHVEQMAIGTELQWLQQHAPASLWQELIARVRKVFPNALTYNMNWTTLDQPPVSWLRDPNLALIGVSAYFPLVDTPTRVATQDMPALWHAKIKMRLDALASQLGKKVLISEIGYRNSSDALYLTWEDTTTAPADPEEQASAYDAALRNVISDPLIAGTFFWGWDDVARFTISAQPAVAVLHKWYSPTNS